MVEILQNAKVNQVDAPANQEFIKLQLFFLCSNDNLIYTSHNSTIRDTTVNNYINLLVENLSGIQEPPKYILNPVLDEDVYKKLMNDGIKEIDFGISSCKDTLDYINKNQKLQTGLFFDIQSLFKNSSEEDRNATEYLALRMVIQPKKNWEKAEVMKLTSRMANNLMDNDGADDGFSIITGNGLKITRNGAQVKYEFNIAPDISKLNSKSFFDGLFEAYNKFDNMELIVSDDAV